MKLVVFHSVITTLRLVYVGRVYSPSLEYHLNTVNRFGPMISIGYKRLVWICKPRSGIINSPRLKTKYGYKCAIKKAVNEFELINADEISAHLLNKENNKFWRSWNNKYKNP